MCCGPDCARHYQNFIINKQRAVLDSRSISLVACLVLDARHRGLLLSVCPCTPLTCTFPGCPHGRENFRTRLSQRELKGGGFLLNTAITRTARRLICPAVTIHVLIFPVIECVHHTKHWQGRGCRGWVGDRRSRSRSRHMLHVTKIECPVPGAQRFVGILCIRGIWHGLWCLISC